MKKNLLRYVNAQDLKAFGLIPELLGRLPVVTHLDPLDAKRLRAILTEPKNALIKQYIRLFELEGIQACTLKKTCWTLWWKKPWNTNWVQEACAASAKAF
jgi:ATP-dependent protease Clp ATPase subunit